MSFFKSRGVVKKKKEELIKDRLTGSETSLIPILNFVSLPLL